MTRPDWDSAEAIVEGSIKAQKLILTGYGWNPKTPTVMRITCVRDLNMKNTERYGIIMEKAKPTYVEVKAYVHVGFSRLRLGFESIPSHKEIREFSIQIAGKTGYRIVDESTESRVVLLSRLERATRFGDG